MPPTAPSPFHVDLLRASLGPALARPYEHAMGPVPWLTAGTLSWRADAAEEVLDVWGRWTQALSPSVLTAVRIGAVAVAVDVAAMGDPSGVPGRLATLRDLTPARDTVTMIAPRTLRSESALTSAAVALPAMPPVHALLGATADAPEGLCLGVRHTGPDGFALIGVGPVAERPRLLAAVDQVTPAWTALPDAPAWP